MLDNAAEDRLNLTALVLLHAAARVCCLVVMHLDRDSWLCADLIAHRVLGTQPLRLIPFLYSTVVHHFDCLTIVQNRAGDVSERPIFHSLHTAIRGENALDFGVAMGLWLLQLAISLAQLQKRDVFGGILNNGSTLLAGLLHLEEDALLVTVMGTKARHWLARACALRRTLREGHAVFVSHLSLLHGTANNVMCD